MAHKRNLNILLIVLVFVFACAVGDYKQVKIVNKSYLISFDSGIPKSFQIKINSMFKQNNGYGENVKININNYLFKQYEVYSGRSLRALESEAKSSLQLTIVSNGNEINKSLMSMKRFDSIELNPLAEQEMLSFIENEMFDDLLNQIIIEVSLIDL
tara:strand:+ start:993 stop:1460 length:468 start_codon:yes stop_codon:yes gene_type:complete